MVFTNRVLMVRPAHFGFNTQTQKSNTFQSVINLSESEIAKKAVEEFDMAVDKLRSLGVEVFVVQDAESPITPDAIFPNNWFSTHGNGNAYVYNMLTPNRKAEVNLHALAQAGYSEIEDLRHQNNFVLEGTGSMVIDHDAKIIYACVSERTELAALRTMGEELGMQVCAFTATNTVGIPIYHTNVMMFVMNGMVAICLESIFDANERQAVRKTIEQTGKEVLELSLVQLNNFSGNMIQLVNKHGSPILVASDRAWQGLSAVQKNKVKKLSAVCTLPISTIETIGGGSARCMIAELF